ncbi:MAG: hypothetical protein EPN23_02160 [Verrucomicrobia bacterium]|nr:MAG: hypothetical protein EPN23_02160 [Verrucomicrobiota bacterium]
MKAVVTLSFTALLLMAAHAAEWERYQVILDRHPFGALTAKDATVTPDYAKSLRLSAIWTVHGQLRAGFEDAAVKRDFVLACGEKSEDGLELVEVRYADEAVVVRKGTETTVLHMQAGASTNTPLNIAPPPGSPAALTINPWREFYERYRSRRREERSNQVMQITAPDGGPVPQMQMNGAVAPPMPTAITPEMESQLQTQGVIPPSHKKRKSY